jgi:beta-lactam-binding protein with PASTA domain
MNEEDAFRLYRGPGWLGVILTSLVTSSCVLLGFLWAVQQGFISATALKKVDQAPPAAAPAPAAAATPANVKVPTLLGLPSETAQELLTGRGLRMVVREKRESRYEAGTVVAQDPLADSTLPRDTQVQVSLSSGPAAQVAVPALEGKPLEEALKELGGLGLVAGAVTGPESGERFVKASEPVAGTQLAPGSSVKLTVEAAGVEVPKLRGLSVPAARKALTQLGLSVGRVRERYDDYQELGTVLDQTPAAGSMVARGTTIDIVRNPEE